MNLDREQALESALGQIERQFGKGSVMRMSDRPAVEIGAVSTGSLPLDLALGVGGLPRGRIVEIFGPEASGKTTLVYHVIAEAQRRGGICAFIDAEHSMDPSYAKRIGVDIDQLLVSQPDTGEQGLEIAELLLRSGALDVVAVAGLLGDKAQDCELGFCHRTAPPSRSILLLEYRECERIRCRCSRSVDSARARARTGRRPYSPASTSE